MISCPTATQGCESQKTTDNFQPLTDAATGGEDYDDDDYDRDDNDNDEVVDADDTYDKDETDDNDDLQQWCNQR